MLKILGTVFLFVSILAGTASAKEAVLAIEGYDPVAYFTQDSAVEGSEAHEVLHDGKLYRFASEEHRKLFEAEPSRYLPEYGGFCSYGVSQGYKVPVDPHAFSVVDGKLYLNFSKGVRARWSKDIAGYIAQANENWGNIGAHLRCYESAAC
ncbi:YHS domain-containing (seleno)protein [Kiloniella sp. b19]|uniref:YHS domain-containing (seleno)protein n=1 Tax=Kiloniella sp. GXU_MW_B19 TaxID=3141326 RepID=UPI0031E2BCC1